MRSTSLSLLVLLVPTVVLTLVLIGCDDDLPTGPQIRLVPTAVILSGCVDDNVLVVVGSDCRFTNDSSVPDPSLNPLASLWTVAPPGSQFTSYHLSYTFRDAGSHTVRLRVTTSTDESDDTEVTVEVVTDSEAAALASAFGGEPTRLETGGVAYTFDGPLPERDSPAWTTAMQGQR
ncbi:MAG: hypothetical protein AAGD06_22470 [Acidobacteriota bacterium]